MVALSLVLTAVISYLLGSCNSAIIVSKLLYHQDIREHGSKNAGLTNTLRCYGKRAALITLVGDLAKGVVAVLLSIFIVGKLTNGGIDTQLVGYIAGMFAILGHIFPVYYGFKGGKGILVASSILIVIDPITFAIVIPFFLIVSLVTRYVSVGSISAAVAYPVITFCVNLLIGHKDMTHVLLYTACTAVTGVLLIYMHRTNIERLKNGTENKLFAKKPEGKEESYNG
ncbi:MAG: glycerol-3-phosphate 1-O-acyltransferase PlsY [Oscillospiraceae bacterium]|nr:glycerol-3-phosphate 1-O-acyltransferase PlsY [Oscillospiraceae bacterium]MBQ8979054.1 glycerol-3-phosphate 1-O-acyltransferase PlsY [Oscillospiraceae bacterium]